MTFNSTFLKLKQKSIAPRICCFVGSKPNIFDIINNVMCTNEFSFKVTFVKIILVTPSHIKQRELSLTSILIKYPLEM